MGWLLMMAVIVAFLLAGCATTGVAGPAPPGASAPIEAPAGKLALITNATVTKETVRTANETVRAAVSVSAALRAVGVVKPGTPKALAIANALDSVRRWVNVVTEAQQLGQAANAYAAFQQAEVAYGSLLKAIGDPH